MKKLLFSLLFAALPMCAHAQTAYTLAPGQCDVFTTNTVCGPSQEIDVNGNVAGVMALNKLPSGALFIWQYDAQGQNGTYTPVNPDGTFVGGSINITYFTQTVYTGGRYRVKRTITYMTGTITR